MSKPYDTEVDPPRLGKRCGVIITPGCAEERWVTGCLSDPLPDNLNLCIGSTVGSLPLNHPWNQPRISGVRFNPCQI